MSHPHGTIIHREKNSVWLGDQSDMEFVQKFTPPDFQAKKFTSSISPDFNSFSGKKTQKMSENEEIYTAGKNFTLLPAVTAWTNSTSASSVMSCCSVVPIKYTCSQQMNPVIAFDIAVVAQKAKVNVI